MPLDIAGIVEDAFNRTAQTNGLMYIALFFAVGTVNTVFGESLMAALGVAKTTATVNVPLAVSTVLVIIGSALSIVLWIGALRTFVSTETETIPREHLTEKLFRPLVHIVLGGIVFAALLGVGFLLFILPGIYLLIALYFWNVFVIVEDNGFLDAFRNSWELTDGHRLRLFFLGLLIILISITVTVIFSLPATLLVPPESLTAAIITQLPSAAISVFGIATVAQAYKQLHEL